MGFDFNAAGGPAHCCGIVHDDQGDTAASVAFAANSMRHFAKYGAKHVLTWCPSGNEHYDEVVAPGQGVASRLRACRPPAFLARTMSVAFELRAVEKRAQRRRAAFATTAVHPQSDADWQSTSRMLGAIPGQQLVQIAH